MAEVRAIIFDAGDVVLGPGPEKFLSRVKETLGLQPKSNSANRVSFNQRMNRGEISSRQMLKELYPQASKEQLEDILKIWTAAWPTDWEMVELVKRLKKCYIVSMLSNSTYEHIERLKQEGVIQLFEKPVLSHEKGIIKPDRRLFELTLKNLGLKAEQCVFVDDAAENIGVARKMGFKTVRFKSRQQCEAELRKLGVEF